MILLVNTFLTHSMNPYHRGHLHRDDNFDIFLYTVSSLAAVDRWSHVVFNVRLDAHYQAHWAKLHNHIAREFEGKCQSIEIRNGRCENQVQWRELVERLCEMPDPYVWYLCNHDHLFTDYDHHALDTALAAMDAEPLEKKAVYHSHWPEFNRTIQNWFPDDFTVLSCGTIAGLHKEMDSIQIVSKPLLRSWWIEPNYGDMYLPRSDWQHIHETSPFRVFAPYREIGRHYDGYSHLFDYRHVPPMTIPPGFFERNIRIRYGYPDNRDGWVNVNPFRPYKSATPDGVDYRCVVEDLPLFWQDRITEIDTSDEHSPEELLSARNQAVREYMTAPCGHPHLGDKMPPEEYIQKSMRQYESPRHHPSFLQ